MAIVFPDNPAKDDLLSARPTLWLNPHLEHSSANKLSSAALFARVAEAQANWQSLAPLLSYRFPELEATNGQISSKLIEATALREALGYGSPEYGRIFLKADSDLPIAGSIKARGGLYEVYLFAISLATEAGLLLENADYRALASERAREVFGKYTIAVGSTGNLGLSVGIAARSLGFKAVVHMSSDAKQWKVDRLTEMGVKVIRHKSDYSTAVERAREESNADENTYFVDDESSEQLFFGYSAAGAELASQLSLAGVTIDADHPLFVYLPCGIGGAPGGVTVGLKSIFGNAAHCFFVEPVQSPCGMLQLMSESDELLSVYDIGLTNCTEADGMAVARMSSFVASVIKPLLSGCLTVRDEDLFRGLWHAMDTQGIRLEPSAAASFVGPKFIVESPEGQRYLDSHGLNEKRHQAIHVLWTTGGAFVPDQEYETFLDRGAAQVWFRK